MIYEVEIVRIDDEFDVLEIEADTPEEAMDKALDESFIISKWNVQSEEFYSNLSDVKRNELLFTTFHCFDPCQQIIVRDEDGNEVYNQLYSETF